MGWRTWGCVPISLAENGRMNAIPCTGRPGNEAVDRVRHAAAFLALLALVAGSPVAAQEPAAEQEPTAAVLKLRDIDFLYRSSAAHLSCSELQGRVASILRALGARNDVAVAVNDCDVIVAPEEPPDTLHTPYDHGQDPSDRGWGSFGRLPQPGNKQVQSTHVRVRAMMPIEVTPEVLAEMERDKSRRELVSRVTGNPAARLSDPIVFQAQRQLITLSRRTVDLQPGECELLEQMSTSVFPKLGVRVVRRGHVCGRDRVSRIPPQVTVQALMPVMPKSPQLAPAAGESDPSPSAPAASETKSSESATVTQPE